MNNRKVIFIDVDQTIYDNRYQVLYPSTLEILQELSLNPNIDLFLATGRTLSTMGHLDNIKKYFKGFVTNNGQTVSIDNKIIYEKVIPNELIRKTEVYCNNNDISLAYVGDYESDTNFLTDKAKIAFHNFQIHNVRDLHKQYFDHHYKVKQFWLFTDQEKLELFKNEVPELQLIAWPGNFGSDGLIPGTSKVDGVKKVIELLGYKYENTYAIGDGDNDVEMLKAVNNSVCMGNGTEKAKNAATFVTDNIENDGFYKGLKYILTK